MAEAAEIWFYHLERSSVEATVPPLLERCLERGWRALVRSASPARLTALDGVLWTWRPSAWLPHGPASDTTDPRAPILLGENAPDAREALFLIHGADWDPAQMEGVQRIFVVFDGRNEDVLAQARSQWRRAKAQGLNLAYWNQNEDGKWQRRDT